METCATAAAEISPQQFILGRLKKFDDLIRQRLACTICYDLLQDPVQTRCGHLFCNWCILKSLKKSSHCPTCKSTISKRSLLSRETVVDLLKAAKHINSTIEVDRNMESTTEAVTPVALEPEPEKKSHGRRHCDESYRDILSEMDGEFEALDNGTPSQIVSNSRARDSVANEDQVVAISDDDDDDDATISWPGDMASLIVDENLDKDGDFLASATQQRPSARPPLEANFGEGFEARLPAESLKFKEKVNNWLLHSEDCDPVVDDDDDDSVNDIPVSGGPGSPSKYRFFKSHNDKPADAAATSTRRATVSALSADPYQFVGSQKTPRKAKKWRLASFYQRKRSYSKMDMRRHFKSKALNPSSTKDTRLRQRERMSDEGSDADNRDCCPANFRDRDPFDEVAVRSPSSRRWSTTAKYTRAPSTSSSSVPDQHGGVDDESSSVLFRSPNPADRSTINARFGCQRKRDGIGETRTPLPRACKRIKVSASTSTGTAIEATSGVAAVRRSLRNVTPVKAPVESHANALEKVNGAENTTEGFHSDPSAHTVASPMSTVTLDTGNDGDNNLDENPNESPARSSEEISFNTVIKLPRRMKGDRTSGAPSINFYRDGSNVAVSSPVPKMRRTPSCNEERPPVIKSFTSSACQTEEHQPKKFVSRSCQTLAQFPTSELSPCVECARRRLLSTHVDQLMTPACIPPSKSTVVEVVAIGVSDSAAAAATAAPSDRESIQDKLVEVSGDPTTSGRSTILTEITSENGCNANPNVSVAIIDDGRHDALVNGNITAKMADTDSDDCLVHVASEEWGETQLRTIDHHGQRTKPLSPLQAPPLRSDTGVIGDTREPSSDKRENRSSPLSIKTPLVSVKRLECSSYLGGPIDVSPTKRGGKSSSTQRKLYFSPTPVVRTTGRQQSSTRSSFRLAASSGEETMTKCPSSVDKANGFRESPNKCHSISLSSTPKTKRNDYLPLRISLSNSPKTKQNTSKLINLPRKWMAAKNILSPKNGPSSPFSGQSLDETENEENTWDDEADCVVRPTYPRKRFKRIRVHCTSDSYSGNVENKSAQNSDRNGSTLLLDSDSDVGGSDEMRLEADGIAATSTPLFTGMNGTGVDDDYSFSSTSKRIEQNATGELHLPERRALDQGAGRQVERESDRDDADEPNFNAKINRISTADISADKSSCRGVEQEQTLNLSVTATQFQFTDLSTETEYLNTPARKKLEGEIFENKTKLALLERQLKTGAVESEVANDDDNDGGGTICRSENGVLPTPLSAEKRATPAVVHPPTQETDGTESLDDSYLSLELMASNDKDRQRSPTLFADGPSGANRKQSSRSTADKMFFVTSMLTYDQQKNVEKMASHFNIELDSTFNDKTTHVIVKRVEKNICAKSLKYILGVTRHCYVVAYDWTFDCMTRGHLISEDDYEIEGEVTVGPSFAPRTSRLAAVPLFFNYEFHYVGDLPDLSKETFIQILNWSGARHVSNPSLFSWLPNRQMYILVANNSSAIEEGRKLFRKFKIPVMLMDWVMHSLAVYDVRPRKAYSLD